MKLDMPWLVDTHGGLPFSGEKWRSGWRLRSGKVEERDWKEAGEITVRL